MAWSPTSVGPRTPLPPTQPASPLPPPGGYPTSPGGGGGDPTTPNPNALDLLYATFPFLRQLGIPISQMQQWAVQGLSGEALYSAITQTTEYQTMFAGIRRDDGTIRMNEAQFLQQQDAYRQLLHQYVDPNHEYTTQELQAFFEQDIDPNELKQRLDVYDTVKRGSQDVKDAFYVYAGMRPSDDQLYWAVVSPSAAKAMNDEYNQRVASQPLDYQTWITRATETGLSRVVQQLQDLQDRGVVTGTAIQQISQLAPDLARQMMDLLYHGGDPSRDTSQLLQLPELLHAFEYSMIGSAATQSGFQLPDLARIEQLRTAGVDRAKALQAYSDFSQQQNLLSGMVQRAQLGTGFSQDDFEKAMLLQQGPAAGQLANAEAQDKALAHASGTASVSQDQATGQIRQAGLRPAFG